MSSRHKQDKKTAAANGPVERHYRGVHKLPGGRYGAYVKNNKTRIYLGTFDTAEEAALAYDSAARHRQGNKAKTNFPNPNHLLGPEAAVPQGELELSLSSYSCGDAAAGTMFTHNPVDPLQQEALELSLSNYSSGNAATGPMFMHHPAPPLPPEALELSLSSYSSGGYAVAEPMFMYHPADPLPPEALELSLASYYSGHVAAGPMFMDHPGMINNDIHNNVNMSYETYVGGSSNSGYSECWKSKNLELGPNFPPQ